MKDFDYSSFLELIKKYIPQDQYTLSYKDTHETFWIDNLASAKVIFISIGTIKTIWNLSYIYNTFYENFLAGVSPYTPHINITNTQLMKKLVERRDNISTFLRQVQKNNPLIQPLDQKINPRNQPFVKRSHYWVANEITKYALWFMALHEYSHILVNNYHFSFTPPEYEETWCDNKAFSLYNEKVKKMVKRQDQLCAKMGLQIALTSMNTYSTAIKNFGTSHEKTYMRIINTMQPISENDDEYWCLALSTLCFEAYILGIQPSPRPPFETYQKTYDNFKEVVNQWVNLFKDYEVDICLI